MQIVRGYIIRPGANTPELAGSPPSAASMHALPAAGLRERQADDGVTRKSSCGASGGRGRFYGRCRGNLPGVQSQMVPLWNLFCRTSASIRSTMSGWSRFRRAARRDGSLLLFDKVSNLLPFFGLPVRCNSGASAMTCFNVGLSMPRAWRTCTPETMAALQSATPAPDFPP